MINGIGGLLLCGSSFSVRLVVAGARNITVLRTGGDHRGGVGSGRTRRGGREAGDLFEGYVGSGNFDRG